MSTSQDEIIELVDLDSSASSQTKTPRTFARNKVGSPPPPTLLSPVSTHANNRTDTEDVFLVKRPRLPPVAKPRKSTKQKKPKSPATPSETSNNDDGCKSEGRKSYRKLLKDRFKTVKQQAGRSAAKVAKLPSLKGDARRIVTLSRGIEIIQRENREIDADISRRALNELEDGKITRRQKYRFFCEDAVYEKTESKEEEEESRRVKKKLLGGSSATHVSRRAENFDFFLEMANTELLWTADKGEKVSLNDKLNGEDERFLRNEGFYVKETPKVNRGDINILEQRLLRDDRKWFDCEGNLAFREDPRVNKSHKPLRASVPSNFTEPIPACQIVPEIQLRSVFSPEDKANILEVHIYSIKFTHHPLFSAEHVLEQRLAALYDVYRQQVVSNSLERLRTRLDALRRAQKNLESGNSSGSVKMKTYVPEIKKLRERLLEEGKAHRNNVQVMLETWRSIRGVRERNGFSSTSVKLSIRKLKENDDQKKRDLKKQIEKVVFKEELLENTEEEGEEEARLRVDQDVELREEIEVKFESSVKPPGEPELHFSLSHDHDVTSSAVASVTEKLRRAAVSSTKIHLKICCNELEVCKSKLVVLNDTFACVLDETVSMQVKSVPESIIVDIYEQSGRSPKRNIASMRLNVPSSRDFSEEYFTKNELIQHHKHQGGVGSGVELSEMLDEYSIAVRNSHVLNTAGFIVYSVSAGDDDQKLAAVEEGGELKSILNADDTIDVNKLKEWTKMSRFDPQDPKNFVLFDYIRDYRYNEEMATRPSQNIDYFRCNADLGELNFCEHNEISRNLRFTLLELRDRNEPEFAGMPVPIRVKEIPANALCAYKKRTSESYVDEEEAAAAAEEEEEEDVDSRRARGSKFLKSVHTKVYQMCKDMDQNLEYEDVVNEKLVSHVETIIRTITSNIFNWLRLQPSVSEPLPAFSSVAQSSDEITNRTCTQPKIFISVISASNVPARVRTDSETRPFVVVTCNNVSTRSKTSSGSNPRWQEEIAVAFDSSSDYLNHNALRSSSNTLRIDLFDEEADSSNWLGNVQIPASAVCAIGKLAGTFKLNKPSILLGYDDDQFTAASRSSSSSSIGFTCLNLSIAVEPNIPNIRPNMEELPCSEPPYLHKYILEFNGRFNRSFPSRKFSALGIDVNGRTVCVTRFIRTLEPPQINRDGFDVTAAQCARFVSMIPFTDANGFYEHVWLSTEQLLALSIGSVTDHAIALACYLMALNVDVWLLLGTGIPQGPTAFVLAREQDDHCIYEVTTGAKHHLSDPIIPLQSVYCVINNYNVWANVQKTELIASTRFDFTRRSDWLPLFAGEMTAPSNTVQTKLHYWFDGSFEQLEGRIEKKLRKRIAKFRKLERTVWNHSLASAFKRAMSTFEAQITSGSSALELHTEIRNFLRHEHGAAGFVVNLPYAGVNAVVEFVKNTGAHLCADPNVEFALAVHVHSYSNQVSVVWIMLATVKR